MAASPVFHLALAAAFAASIWAARLVEFDAAGGGRVSVAVVVAAGAAFRLMLLPAEPALSDDIHRYLWDGRVQAAGINPYRHAPADPALDGLAEPIRGRINNPELPTIYPPVTQAVFLAAALLPGGAAALKTILILCDLATILAVAALLRRRGKDPAQVVLYAWSPLPVVEIAWSGHADPIGVCLLACGCLALAAGRPALSAAAAAFSVAAKYAGLLALPAVARRAGGRTLVAMPVLALAYAPYAGAGWGVFGSLPAYAERWRFNDGIFSALLGIVERARLAAGVRTALAAAGWLDPAARWETSLALRLTEPLSLTKMLAAAAFAVFAVRILRRGWDDPVREIAALLGAALLLAPTVHPWYLLWVAPFLPLVPRLSFLWWTYAAMALGYPMLAARSGGEDPLRGLALVEYGVLFVVMGVESARRRLWETA